jgi:hypothetical protein
MSTAHTYRVYVTLIHIQRTILQNWGNWICIKFWKLSHPSFHQVSLVDSFHFRFSLSAGCMLTMAHQRLALSLLYQCSSWFTLSLPTFHWSAFIYTLCVCVCNSNVYSCNAHSRYDVRSEPGQSEVQHWTSCVSLDLPRLMFAGVIVGLMCLIVEWRIWKENEWRFIARQLWCGQVW